MKTILPYFRRYWQLYVITCILVILTLAIYLFRLRSVPPGLSSAEVLVGKSTYGWHGLSQQVLNLPLLVLRSIIFKLHPYKSAFVLRLPSILLVWLASICVSAVVAIWHDGRAAILGGILFASAAWSLHVARYASVDALYLSALPLLALSYVLFHRYHTRWFVYYPSLAVWGALLYIPGLVWFIFIIGWFERRELIAGWHEFNRLWQHGLYVFLGLLWLPLLIFDFIRRASNLLTWIGFPTHFENPLKYLKQLLSTITELFIRGPNQPTLWLGRTPILDIFTLMMCGVGVYFYIRHHAAQRAKVLGIFFAIGCLLTALRGPVSISLIIPIMYLLATTGIAYMIRIWSSVFPRNPVGHYFGLAIIITAVSISCIYNLRAYFVAWPHYQPTTTVFNREE